MQRRRRRGSLYCSVAARAVMCFVYCNSVVVFSRGELSSALPLMAAGAIFPLSSGVSNNSSSLQQNGVNF